MKKYNKIMEVFWGLTAILTLIFGINVILKVGFEEGWLYLVLPVVAAILFSMRRYMRRKLEKHEKK